MRVIQVEIKAYTFEELSDSAKQKAIYRFAHINVDHDWWEFVYEDAEQAGLKITWFNLDRTTIHIERTSEPEYIAQHLLDNHGSGTDTYEAASRFMVRLAFIGKEPRDTEAYDAWLDEYNKAVEYFMDDLKSVYLSMLDAEYDYLTSDEAIVEAIVSNEYEFYEDGTVC